MIVKCAQRRTMRSHVCTDCTKSGKKVEECRVRVYVYWVFGHYCPREADRDKKQGSIYTFFHYPSFSRVCQGFLLSFSIPFLKSSVPLDIIHQLRHLHLPDTRQDEDSIRARILKTFMSLKESKRSARKKRELTFICRFRDYTTKGVGF